MTLEHIEPLLIDIPKHIDARGNLSVIDSTTCLPFSIKRVFYVYDIPTAAQRGGHAHHKLHQFLWCVSGAVEVSTISGSGEAKAFTLSLPWQGLYIPPLVWAHETALTAGCTYFVAASDYYDETDYIRDLATFMQLS